jgi:hypothetical protein
MVALGNKVRDSITGFEGIVIGRTEWLYGCTRLGVEPQKLHEGKPVEAQWFDEQRLTVLTDDKPQVSKDSKARTGGPHNDPKPRKSY